jgi:hypothetical protein
MKIKNLLIIFVLFFYSNAFCGYNDFTIPSVKEGYKAFNVVTYFGYSGKPVTVSWDAPNEPDIDGYKLRIYLIEQERYVVNNIFVHSTEYVYTPSFSGHHVLEIKAVDLGGKESPWVSSMDDNVSKVNDEYKGWWIYVYTEPPGEIIIDW